MLLELVLAVVLQIGPGVGIDGLLQPEGPGHGREFCNHSLQPLKGFLFTAHHREGMHPGHRGLRLEGRGRPMILPELVVVGNGVLHPRVLFLAPLLRTQKPHQVEQGLAHHDGVLTTLGELHGLLVVCLSWIPLFLRLEDVALEVEGHVHDVAVGKLAFKTVELHEGGVELVLGKVAVGPVIQRKGQIDVLARVRILGEEGVEEFGRLAPVLKPGKI